MATPTSTFGTYLRTKRKAAALSLRDVSDRLGVSFGYLSHVERGFKPPLQPEHWPALVAAVPGISLADLERLAAITAPLEIDLAGAPPDYAELALALAQRVRSRDIPPAELPGLLAALGAQSRAPVRAHGRVVDDSGRPVQGRAFVYRLSRARGWIAVVGSRAHAGRIAGPLDGNMASLTDKSIQFLAPGDARGEGFFDVPGGLTPGDYALDVHLSDGTQAWAWPFAVTDGAAPQDVRLGGTAGAAKPKPQPAPPRSPPTVTSTPVPPRPPAPGLAKQFTKGTFTASFSYYGLGGAPLDRIQRDLERFRNAGFTNARVWTEWQKPSPDSRFLTLGGQPIAAQIQKLRAALDFAAGIGMTFDLTMSTGRYDATKIGGGSGEATYDISAHKNAVRFLCSEFRGHLGLAFLDLGNEHNQRGAGGDGSPATGHISPGRAKELIDVARAADPARRLTLSTEGDAAAAKDAYAKISKRGTKLDLFTPHFLRAPGWGQQEGENAKKVGLSPLYHQEPARRGDVKGYDAGDWSVADFEASFRTARAAGSVGICFHNERGFDLSAKAAWDQLDVVEREVVAHVAEWLK